MSRLASRAAAAGLLTAALAVAPAYAQHQGHPMPSPAPKPAAKPSSPKPAAKAAARPPAKSARSARPAAAKSPAADDHAGHAAPAAAAIDHAAMGHDGMAHDAMPEMDHAAMGHGGRRDLPADAAPRTPIPALTDADRAAAFPSDAHGHAVHDQRLFSYWLVDRLEWQDTGGGSLGWEGLAWLGGDIHRVWLRSEGEASGGDVESGNVEVLYGRSIASWWDVVAGVRHDFGHGPSRTYAAFGLQGLAPYKFEVEATGFIGANGQGGASLEAEYDTLITNRLILQWQGGANLYAKDDAAIGVGSGLSTIEAGARLRYEFNRRFAPYVGVEFERAFGRTADLRRVSGEPARDTRAVAGIRFWF